MVKKEEKEIDILQHELVPKHRILSDEEKKGLYQKYGIKGKDLPRISSKDPVIKAIDAKVHDVLEITRKSSTAGETKYYRIVVSDK